MKKKSLTRTDLLTSLIRTLVEEWGYAEVSRRLSEFKSSGDLPSTKTVGNDKRVNRKTEKPTAKVLAEKVSLPPDQKRLIQSLAEKYDAKQFLPSSGDIRYFFEVHGEVRPPPKQRNDAFRKILKLLSVMPENSLRIMIEDDAHSGPSRLGPLSDAMRGVGEQRSLDRGLEPESLDQLPSDLITEQEGNVKGSSKT